MACCSDSCLPTPIPRGAIEAPQPHGATTVQAELDRIGVGCYNLWSSGFILAICCGMDHAAVALADVTATTMSRVFGVDMLWASGLVTILLMGIVVGGFLGGIISDLWGRRPIVVVSLAGVTICLVLSSCCSSYIIYASLQFLLGLTAGMGQSPSYTLSNECSPTAWRFVLTLLVANGPLLGQISAQILAGDDDPNYADLHWRSLLLTLCPLPLLCAVLGFFFLEESPRFSALAGDTEEAMATLGRISWQNCAIPPSQPLRPSSDCELPYAKGIASKTKQRLSVLFSGQLLFPTLYLMYSMMVYNAMLEGGNYAFPQILQRIFPGSVVSDLIVKGTSANIFLGIPIFVVNLLTERKTNVRIYLSGSFVSLLMFAYAATRTKNSEVMQEVAKISFFGFRGIAPCANVITMQYMGETFPIEVRALGTAIGVAAGRAVGAASPMIFEMFRDYLGVSSFFYALAVVAIIQFCLVSFMPRDPAGICLEESAVKINIGKKYSYDA